ncbi:MAG: hypothetical protein SPL80_06065 [Bacilli bacterium]|nr:hypothetical protein [Bacilli bacterium]
MFGVAKKRYSDFYRAYLEGGIESLSFMMCYVLYCDAYLFYSGDDIDAFASQLNQRIYRWINQSSDSEIIAALKSIKVTEDVFPGVFTSRLFECNRHLRLEKETIETILEDHLIPLSDLLKNKKLVDCFEPAFKKHILSMPDGISLLIDRWDRGAEYFLPKFNGKEVDRMIETYVASDYRNPSELNLLFNHQNSDKTYSVDPRQKEKIRKAIEESVNDPNIVILKEEEITWETGIDAEIETPCSIKFQTDHYQMVASKRFIDDHPGADGLFSILSKAVRLFDEQIRVFGLYHPLKEKRLLVELEHRTKGQYGGNAFREIESLRTSQFHLVVEYLRNKGDPIEKRLETITSSLSDKKGHILDLSINLYPDYDPLPKAEGVFNQIEGLMKQYYVLRTYGKLTRELFDYAVHPKIRSLKSRRDNNYLCLPLDEKRLLPIKILFQKKLYSQNSGVELPNDCTFASAFLIANIEMSQLTRLDQHWAQILIEQGLLSPNEDGYLKFVDENQIRVLAKLFMDQSVYAADIPEEFIPAAEELVTKGILLWHDGLLSKQEEEFVDYYLSNGRPRAAALRNKYEHGSTYKIEDREALLDYCSGLRILCILVFKIKKEVESWD